MPYSNTNSIAFIPIDNRPICYDIVGDIVSIDENIRLFMPDISILGGLNTKSDTDKLFEFIKNLPPVDYYVIALDTLAYGGLVTS